MSYERDVSKSRQAEIERDGNIFTFPNTASIAPGAGYAVDIKDQTTYRNALDYAPFNALSIANTSNSDIIVYINTTSPTNTSQVMIVPRLSNQTYDLTNVRAFFIKNNDASNTITAFQIFPSFIRNAYNTDTLSETLANKLGVLGSGVRFGNQKKF